jgi:hypothetical protein
MQDREAIVIGSPLSFLLGRSLGGAIIVLAAGFRASPETRFLFDTLVGEKEWIKSKSILCGKLSAR